MVPLMRLLRVLPLALGFAAPAAAAPAPAAFATCRACHATMPGQSLIGPTLFGVVGRKAAAVPGFAYSPPFKALKVTWNDATLDKWLTNPAAMAPGTRMAYPGIADPAQRKAVIAYLKTLR
jgi:cytochrome c